MGEETNLTSYSKRFNNTLRQRVFRLARKWGVLGLSSEVRPRGILTCTTLHKGSPQENAH